MISGLSAARVLLALVVLPALSSAEPLEGSKPCPPELTAPRHHQAAADERREIETLLELSRERMLCDPTSAVAVAREALARAERAYPERLIVEVARGELADALVEAGRMQEAEQMARQQLIWRQLNREGWVDRIVRIRLANDDAAGALRVLNDELESRELRDCRSAKRCPTACNHFSRRGQIYARLGATDAAISSYREAGQQESSPSPCRVEANTAVARLLASTRDFKGAEDAYWAALRMAESLRSIEGIAFPVDAELVEEFAAFLESQQRRTDAAMIRSRYLATSE